MNVFYLDKDPSQAAQWMTDSHVIKMVLESAQLLSTAHRVLDGVPYKAKSKNGRMITKYDHPDDRLYQATHVNHPSAVWVRQSSYNYQWLTIHFASLLDEYFVRYGKQHACTKMLFLYKPPGYIPCCTDFTDPPSAMPDKYKISNNAVLNYRYYYSHGKSHLHRWTKRTPPDWILT